MKQREKCSGREFDSPHLHQKKIMKLFAKTRDNQIVKVIRAGKTIHGERMVLTEIEMNSIRVYRFVGQQDMYTMLCDEHGNEVFF